MALWRVNVPATPWPCEGLMSQQHRGVSQGSICSHNCLCCLTETQVADPTFYLTQSQYTDTRPTSLSTDPVPPGAWQGSNWSANFEVTGTTRPKSIPTAQARTEPWICCSRGRRLNHLANEAVSQGRRLTLGHCGAHLVTLWSMGPQGILPCYMSNRNCQVFVIPLSSFCQDSNPFGETLTVHTNTEQKC